MYYEVKTFRLGVKNHFNTYLFNQFAAAMAFIHTFKETHGSLWVVELIQE